MKPLKLEDLAEPLRSRVLAALEKQTRLARPAILEVQPIPMQPPELSEAHKANSHPRKLNKTETRFFRDWPPGTSGLILAQALTLPFGDGTSYRPDFVLVTDGRVVAYEVKGGHVGKVAWSRHGIERFRRARERFREISFELWIWKDHQWRKL